ncbi:hypothetical protein SDC9_53693 [bioreactor metagenome]|uniref:Uncharacterized protein n=1 Tax=bioreactor metagenome TaxID=1076179 RepID=A0A644WUM3_9ZZZZ
MNNLLIDSRPFPRGQNHNQFLSVIAVYISETERGQKGFFPDAAPLVISAHAFYGQIQSVITAEAVVIAFVAVERDPFIGKARQQYAPLRQRHAFLRRGTVPGKVVEPVDPADFKLPVLLREG